MSMDSSEADTAKFSRIHVFDSNDDGWGVNHGISRYRHVLFDPIYPHTPPTQILQDHCVRHQTIQQMSAHRVKLYPATVYIPISCLRLGEVLPAFFRTGQASLNRTTIPATPTLCQQNRPHTEMGLSGKYYGYPTDVLLHLFIPLVVTGFPASFHDSHKAAHVRPHTQGSTLNLALAEIKQR
ncbi:uncharacterized protein B0T23DRAFT_400037 [Neurospora hispaniola]|uniref:Uncharacterized protein n=1 Tax=Neurospora hispaniola TaxID=588809 RepID=A0AAJ0HZA7_9PEZI|nr:hypothetical protein B0T23DRAFT_400037 [Neurospora hispaniola]